MVAVSLKKKKTFFKQKTAYEMSASLVGSEMCIRDRDKISLSQMTITVSYTHLTLPTNREV
ncbi:hypothetical protein JMUB7536_27710 [Staphylococcus aureus]